MGGDIQLHSEEGKGTEIIVEIPVTLGNKASPSRPQSSRLDFMTWSIPPRQTNDISANTEMPIKTMALYTRNKEMWDILKEMFTSIGITIVNNYDGDPMNVDEFTHDSIFLDMELFDQIPALCIRLLGGNKPTCLVLFNEKERGGFFTAISESENVILVRRPLAIHRISQCLKEPWKYIGGQQHRVLSVKGNSPQPSESMGGELDKLSLISERQVFAKASEENKTLRCDMEDSLIEDDIAERKRILMVEDNEVNGKMGLKLLSIAGFHAELAEHGVAALKRITQPDSKYDVVLMDCQVYSSLLLFQLAFSDDVVDACNGWIGMYKANSNIGKRREITWSSTNNCINSKCSRYTLHLKLFEVLD